MTKKGSRQDALIDAALILATQRQEIFLRNQVADTVLGTIEDFQKHQGVR